MCEHTTLRGLTPHSAVCPHAALLRGVSAVWCQRFMVSAPRLDSALMLLSVLGFGIEFGFGFGFVSSYSLLPTGTAVSRAAIDRGMCF